MWYWLICPPVSAEVESYLKSHICHVLLSLKLLLLLSRQLILILLSQRSFILTEVYHGSSSLIPGKMTEWFLQTRPWQTTLKRSLPLLSQFSTCFWRPLHVPSWTSLGNPVLNVLCIFIVRFVRKLDIPVPVLDVSWTPCVLCVISPFSIRNKSTLLLMYFLSVIFCSNNFWQLLVSS